MPAGHAGFFEALAAALPFAPLVLANVQWHTEPTAVEKTMTFADCPLPLATLVVGFALANGCGRTEMGALVRGSDNAGGMTAGQTGSESGGPGGGAGSGGIGYAGAGGLAVSAGGAGGGTSGICAEAPCLAALFQDCVPEGSCTVEGHLDPSASVATACYLNGVAVSSFATYSGSNLTGSVTVARNGTPCYSIDTSAAMSGSAVSYVFSDGKGQPIATGTTVDKTGSVVVTCNGGSAATVSGACVHPNGDSSGCNMGTCP